MAYHYTDSGLDNVYLENGYTIHPTPYGEGVSIQNSESLHKAISRWLITRPVPLNGAELRFLRTEMECTQRDLAGIIGATEQTLRLWEKGRTKHIPGTADRLLRVLYHDFSGGDVHVRRMLQKLADLDRAENEPTCFSRKNSVWRPKAPVLDGEMSA